MQMRAGYEQSARSGVQTPDETPGKKFMSARSGYRFAGSWVQDR